MSLDTEMSVLYLKRNPHAAHPNRYIISESDYKGHKGTLMVPISTTQRSHLCFIFPNISASTLVLSHQGKEFSHFSFLCPQSQITSPPPK